MACYQQPEPTFTPIDTYVIARVMSAEPIIVEYYCGPIRGWGDDFHGAYMYCTPEHAKQVCEALGSGRVYEIMDGEGGFQIVP